VRIRVIIPAVAKHVESATLDWYSRAARSDTQISVTSLDKGLHYVWVDP
jgi:hypothetical protein